MKKLLKSLLMKNFVCLNSVNTNKNDVAAPPQNKTYLKKYLTNTSACAIIL